MAKLTDTDPMPYGKFKGDQMQNVPYWHLLWLYDNGKANPEVKAYIEDNKEVLEAERKRANQNKKNY